MKLLIIFVLSLFLFSCGSSGSNNDYGPDIIEEENKIIGIKWEAPTTNKNGTPLEDLGGFKVYYGFSSRDYFDVIDVGNVLTYTLLGVPDSGLVLFRGLAYNDTGETINAWSGAWYNGDWKPPNTATGLGVQ